MGGIDGIGGSEGSGIEGSGIEGSGIEGSGGMERGGAEGSGGREMGGNEGRGGSSNCGAGAAQTATEPNTIMLAMDTFMMNGR